MTAWRMVVTQARVRPGEDVLILGVGGGVSSAAVQIAKLCGGRVLVTSSSDAKLERARQLGADVSINYAKEDWESAVYEKTAKRGVDVVLENLGAQTWSSRSGRSGRAAGSSRAAPRPDRSQRPTSVSSSGSRSTSSARPWRTGANSTT